MRRLTGITLLFATLFIAGGARAEEDGPAAEGIAWQKDLSSAMATAKEAGKILMICVNAKEVDGERGEEPAAKGLREVVYRDPRIVTRSRDFVCVMMTPRSSTADHGVLGSLGVEAPIISPQHLFVSPEGDALLYRKEYWSYGKGEKAVEALLGMMEKAEQKHAAKGAAPEAGAEPAGAPGEGDERAEWIKKLLEQLDGTPEERDQALQALITNDKDGDCTRPLIELLPKKKKEVELLEAMIRALGRDKLEAAALPISEFLDHKEPGIRGNSAVSLEYIGSREKKVISALLSAAGREKDEGIANHIYRALGRCGAVDPKARALLVKMAAAGRSEFATYGPAIGLAYFDGDPQAARGVEQILKLIGVPGGGRRGGGQNTVKRALVSWTLACIRDRKSGAFVREELIGGLENVKAFWVDGQRRFWESVARTCDGEDALGEVEGGVRIIVGFARQFDMGRLGAEVRSLTDEYRKGREDLNFKPRGEGLLDTGEDD